MSYVVIARKWRPQTFEELVGQDAVSQTLSNAIRSNRVAHAFLFTGVRGVGKTTAARILAKALNCSNGPIPTPCNECTNCREITAGSAVDVLEIDGASNTGVDDVREIIENVRYQPAKSRFKIYIIDEVHMLSTSAFNALLKTLEEPPPHVKFIFATTDPHKVPHTIHSRCQRYDFKRIPYRLVAERLAHIARSEGIEVSDRALFMIAREGEGSMRDAQSLFDQVLAFAGRTVRDEDVVSALGLADRKVLFAIAQAIVTRDPARALQHLNDLHLYGYDMRRCARELLEHFRNVAVARLVPDAELLSDLPTEERAEIAQQAQQLSQEDCDRCFRLLMTTEGEVARSATPKLVLEMALIKLATLVPVLPADVLLQRLEAIEHSLGSGTSGGSAGALAAAGSVRPARPAPTPAPPALPQRATHQSPVAPAAAPDSGRRPASPGGSWDDFLSFVATEKVTLLTYLRASAPPVLDGPHLTLSVPPGYYYDYLAQKDHTALIEDLARRFFGRPLRVAVNASTSEAGSAAPPGPHPADLQAVALNDPRVQAAVQILGGEVEQVKPRTRRQRGTE